MPLLKDISVQYIKGVGPAKVKLFERLGVLSIEDLMYFFPRRYEDRRNLVPIAKVEVGKWQTITGKVVQNKSRQSWNTKKHVCEITINDGSGRIFCVWFNQPYLKKYFRDGQKIVCHGKVDMYKNRLQMVSPEYEVLQTEEEELLSLKRIVPIYPLTSGITQRFIRKVIKVCLDKHTEDLIDHLPVALRNKHHLANIKRSIKSVHFPEDFKKYEESLRRVSFEEFFFFQISVILRRLSIVQAKGTKHKVNIQDEINFANGFKFELTNAQKKVINEVAHDMKQGRPMLRLLQGDVGCGKTLVALAGVSFAYKNKKQSAMMAPTEILARQHYENVLKLIKDGSFPKMSVELLTSHLNKKEHDVLYKKIKEAQVDFVIGTHALISTTLEFKKLSYVVIDEQHKFGVKQRALLTEKGKNPDILIMTATPIPRTLCITLYGDLDISTIDEMPKGRGKITTKLYNFEQETEVYAKVKSKIKKGRQAYIIYPIIEESETLDLKAADEMYRRFCKNEFKDLNVALVHGRMKKDKTQNIMKKFKAGKIDVLVATTVLEVGVDVANASIMVIEHAERFGLAQLHQLRGRIGRGKYDSDCLLMANTNTEEGEERLKAIVKTTDGFKIAQKDLEIRGPGHYFGRHQHGLNELKVANPLTQMDILELARNEAVELTLADPALAKIKNKDILKVIKQRYPTYLQMVSAG